MNYFNYFTEIEDAFVRRRGRNLFLSPLDWALIESWQQRGIPLHIVIRSIESVFDVFDQQPPGTRTIKSLVYCKEEIEAQYTEWVSAHAGRSDETGNGGGGSQFSIPTVREYIESSIGKLESVQIAGMDEDVCRALMRLRELSDSLTDDMETVDGTLGDVEKMLDRSLMANWDRAEMKKLEKEVGNQLRAYKSEMDAESYKNTSELMLLKRLREEAGVPRLGLYFL